MDEKKVIDSIDEISLSEDARNRIIQNCAIIVQAENEGEVTEYTYSKANTLSHRFAGLAIGAAACAIIVCGTGAAVKMMNKPSADSVLESQTVSSSHSVAETTETLEPPETFENLKPEIIELTRSTRDVGKFLEAACNKFGVGFIEKDYVPYNITPREITEKYGFSVFKYGEFDQAYLFYRGDVRGIGESAGGYGISSMAVADINGDKYPEIYYNESHGFGSYLSGVSYIDLNGANEPDVLCRSINGLEFLFSVEGDTLNVFGGSVSKAGDNSDYEYTYHNLFGQIRKYKNGEILIYRNENDKQNLFAEYKPDFYKNNSVIRNSAALNGKKYILSEEDYREIDEILVEQSNNHTLAEAPRGYHIKDSVIRPAEPYITLSDGAKSLCFYEIEGVHYINIVELITPNMLNYWFMLPEESDAPDRIKEIITQGQEYSEGNVFGKDFPKFAEIYHQFPDVEIKCVSAVPNLTMSDFVAIDSIIESYGSGIMPTEPVKFPDGVSPRESLSFITDYYEIWFYDIIGEDDVIKTVIKKDGNNTEKWFRVYYEEKNEIDLTDRIVSVITNTDKNAEFASLNTIPLLISDFRVSYLDKEGKVTEIPMDSESRMTIRSCIASECGFTGITEDEFGSQDDVEVYTIRCEGEILELSRSGKARYTTKEGRVYHYTYESKCDDLVAELLSYKSQQ